ncbi:hypothetical protein PBY51_011526 [Eleginops maclovinus]|uniref:Major facilitator superfamily (MFS) profile domain-containing protein n=1 Tax=Eleginops maclovinus TaxID=56733 RepID=A0AAN7XVG1_ELEMC|nr:hypothetical protein PBY51_011526 [Eleginops maclovinus]
MTRQDVEAREPLLTREHLGPNELESDEGEIIFDRSSSNSPHDAGESAQRRLTYEEAVEEAGFGLFHWLLLVVCGWANASDAVEILCVSFLLPTARCDLLLSSSDMGLLTASIFLGMMVGGYMWGYLADRRGRRRVLVVSLTVNGVFGGLASLAPWFWLFLLLRFISGIGVGGSIPVIFSYFSEFMPRLRRGAMISALATFWMAGNILAAGLACLTSALAFRLLMPESPKFLMEAGLEKEAIHVFQVMFKLNVRGKGKSLPEFGLCINSKKRAEQEETKPQGSQRERLGSMVKKAVMPIKQMFKGPLRSRSVALLIVFYCISFGYYGLWMWFPELFKRIEEDGGSPCANASLPSLLHNQSCYPVKTKVYMEGFIIAASNLPGNVLTILIMDNTGGKALLSLSLMVSSVSVFFIYEVHTQSQTLLLSCIFSGVSVIAWNSLDVLGTELYPTELRLLVWEFRGPLLSGFFTGVGRVAAIMGNIAFGKLVDSNCVVPILLVSALLLTGGLVALLLPQTKHTELT